MTTPRGLRNLRLDGHLVGLVAPTGYEAEQYRRLRHRIEELAAGRDARVLAVTSAVAHEGKTMTAINLAATLAEADGTRVLLIDADLRRPALAGHFKRLEGGGSLQHVLGDPGGRLRQGVRTLPGSNLSILTAEEAQSGSYDILGSAAFATLVAAARRMFDFVVIDASPLVPVPDGMVLHRVVDGYLLVVAAHSTPRRMLAEALNMLDVHAVIGIVFNQDERAPFGYGHYYRKHVHEYLPPTGGARTASGRP
jgi:capsular exopolysaccharide synthesis family protein